VSIPLSKYDGVTRLLHAALAIGVVMQLSLSSVMRVPAGRGLGVFDWHRRAFELHAKVGLVVAGVCLLHWLWLALPWCRPGPCYLFPWIRSAQRATLATESPLVGTIHGLGLAAITGSAIGGLINYAGYFLGAPIPRLVLHFTAGFHIALGFLIWAFVVGHVGMTVIHRLTDRRDILAMFRV
jgi:cytochrome b561